MFKKWKRRKGISEVKKVLRLMETTSDWDLSTEQEWTFFFLSDTVSSLESLGKSLVNQGFELRPLEETDVRGLYRLAADKYEILTAEQLYDREERFRSLADVMHRVMYSGFEVGPPWSESLAELGEDDDLEFERKPLK